MNYCFTLALSNHFFSQCYIVILHSVSFCIGYFLLTLLIFLFLSLSFSISSIPFLSVSLNRPTVITIIFFYPLYFFSLFILQFLIFFFLLFVFCVFIACSYLHSVLSFRSPLPYFFLASLHQALYFSTYIRNA